MSSKHCSGRVSAYFSAVLSTLCGLEDLKMENVALKFTGAGKYCKIFDPMFVRRNWEK